MKFAEAYLKMLEGHTVARPCFKGYWYIDGVSGKLTIHTKDGEELTDGCLDITVRNTLANDWFVREVFL